MTWSVLGLYTIVVSLKVFFVYSHNGLMVFRPLLWGPIHGRPSLDQGSEGFGFDVQVGGNGNVGRV